MKSIVYVEVCQKINSTIAKDIIRERTKIAFEKCEDVPLGCNLLKDSKWTETSKISEAFTDHVDSIVCSTNEDEECSSIEIDSSTIWKVFVYTLSREEAATETMQHDSEELSVASHIVLPAAEYDGLWESLYYETDIKKNLLNFIETTALFSRKKINPNIISWNKVILLHGPPGTGKTSLCKALAQKAAIRLSDRYSHVELIEINSHSLFSKWFSESGKLVMKLFDEVRRLLENSRALVCVLIDEVESLAHARKSCANGTEPSDAIRVVNALLTQLDQIKSYDNVMILTTSNVTEAIDLAFVDRADIKQFIGQPQRKVIQKIYASCIQELIRKGVVAESTNLGPGIEISTCPIRQFLSEISEASIGLSGRSLRKIPFLAYAIHVQTDECDVPTFMNAMADAVESQRKNEILNK